MHFQLSASAWLLLLLGEATGLRSLQHVGKRDPVWIQSAPLQKYEVSIDSTEDVNTTATETHAVVRRAQPLFLTDKTRKFSVDGNGIPEVKFDVGESYAGQLPISNNSTDENKMFFWFFPSQNPLAKKEIMIWLNGGPGCSSMAGLMQENGPFLWQSGTFRPVKNPFSWTELTNVVWIEQPVGTGFATGKPNATNEEDVARQFLGFWRNFVDTFALQGYKVYITGESYAGAYCPYIADAMIKANDMQYFNMTGMLIYDPVIGEDSMQEEVPVMGLINAWPGLFPFNETFRADLQARDAKCGLTEFMTNGLSYPPKGPLSSVSPVEKDEKCVNIFDDVYKAAFEINPCFNIYEITQSCPLLWDVLGYVPEGATIYFNRTDVKRAIHAPENVNWEVCKDGIFKNGTDRSPPSSRAALPNVIDHTQNVIIGHGALDMVLIANGTLLSIQNMTWGGKLGFQSRPSAPFFVPRHRRDFKSKQGLGTLTGSGVMGFTHTERGLTYVGVEMSGHMVPQYQPAAAFRHVEVLLGRVANLSSTQPFTTQMNYTQPKPSELGGPPATANSPVGGGSGRGSPKSESPRLSSPSTLLPLAILVPLGFALVS
ncbi:hypothetical protein MCOR34_011231 [Pyricularia oryzae]|uniref:Carboxypeptidase n=1 Tax=Pyricularia oryzae TaxID=318829 RepID=A0A4P7NDI9_PYROR|nr:hypothetical protein MCOR34_011231 [Pyricularia oryzae]KAI6587128.1 hypothetical protein MCOR04_004387 [Pyricularia oryzae]QBZ59034.1 hypothetical protein PoMZ_03994 [Pyricularia oryzae]